METLDELRQEIELCVRMKRGGPYDEEFVKKELPERQKRILESLRAVSRAVSLSEDQRSLLYEITDIIENESKFNNAEFLESAKRKTEDLAQNVRE